MSTLVLASPVTFDISECILKCNNVESSWSLYMLIFTECLPSSRKSSTCIALTKEPSFYYYNLLQEFWFTTRGITTTGTITFYLSSKPNHLSFNLVRTSQSIDFHRRNYYAAIPGKAEVKDDLAKLRLDNNNQPDAFNLVVANFSLVYIK